MLKRSTLKRLRKKVEGALKELDRRERRASNLMERVRRTYAMMVPLMSRLEAVRSYNQPAYRAYRRSLRAISSELMSIALELEEISEELRMEREWLERLRALLDVLEERMRRRGL